MAGFTFINRFIPSSILSFLYTQSTTQKFDAGKYLYNNNNNDNSRVSYVFNDTPGDIQSTKSITLQNNYFDFDVIKLINFTDVCCLSTKWSTFYSLIVFIIFILLAFYYLPYLYKINFFFPN